MVPDHTRGAHPAASGRPQNGGVCFGSHTLPLRTVALLTQSYPAELEENSLTTWARDFHFEIIGSRVRDDSGRSLRCRRNCGPSSSSSAGTTPAGALDHEELFGIERERRPVPQIADSSAPSGGKCNFFTFASSSFGKSWTSFL